MVRSARGRDFLRAAVAAGVLVAEPRPLTSLADAQPNLARTRRILFGRLLGLRMLGLAAPRYRGWKLDGLWLTRTGMRDKLGSVAGTMRRAFRRRLWVSELPPGGDRA